MQVVPAPAQAWPTVQPVDAQNPLVAPISMKKHAGMLRPAQSVAPVAWVHWLPRAVGFPPLPPPLLATMPLLPPMLLLATMPLLPPMLLLATMPLLPPPPEEEPPPPVELLVEELRPGVPLLELVEPPSVQATVVIIRDSPHTAGTRTPRVMRFMLIPHPIRPRGRNGAWLFSEKRDVGG